MVARSRSVCPSTANPASEAMRSSSLNALLDDVVADDDSILPPYRWWLPVPATANSKCERGVSSSADPADIC